MGVPRQDRTRGVRPLSGNSLPPEGGRGRRLLWFVALYGGSLAALGLVAAVLRWVLSTG
ncbi:MAG TPA: hypothetical protein DCQ35_04900 [Rhodospirillum rubrum]|nr:hypothetical protein [Rhodospirillum rubrum]HCF18485.1 hypothetical protein [Rhodospirillum rubrum]